MSIRFPGITCFLLLLCTLQTFAAIEEYAFDNAQQEERFKKLTQEMRCPKCLNSPISGSDAPIAADIRAEIYDQIREGRSNREIADFMSSRYGDFILYRPRLTPGTWLLWFGPPLLLLAGFYIIRRMMKNSQQLAPNESALTEEEAAKLARILEDGGRR